MKVLVTGASGFLGGHVAELLSRRGDSVRALVRSTSNRKHLEKLPNVELFEGGVEEVERVREAVDGVDAIVHAAGLVKARSTDEFFAVNVGGTSNLVQAARSGSRGRPSTVKRFVYVSSLEACGPSADGRPVPVDQESPVNAYGRSKLAAEKVVLSAKDELPVVILRPGAIYGPRDGEILDVFKTIQRGLLPLVAGGDAKGVWIYATDCAEACLRAIDADVPSGQRLLRRRRLRSPSIRTSSSPRPSARSAGSARVRAGAPGADLHGGRARGRGLRTPDQPRRDAHAREGQHAPHALGLLVRGDAQGTGVGAQGAAQRGNGPRGRLVPGERLALAAAKPSASRAITTEAVALCAGGLLAAAKPSASRAVTTEAVALCAAGSWGRLALRATEH